MIGQMPPAGKDPPMGTAQPLFSGNPFQFKSISKPAGLQSLDGMTAAEPGKLAGLPTANLKKLGESELTEMNNTDTSSILY